jgi:two-component system sensor histidine kinase/response regulator
VSVPGRGWAGADGHRRRVLVAEDEPVNQIVTAWTLSALGYDADVVADGRQAVEAVSREEYVAVLMDCQMPEMDGYAATAEIRRLEAESRRTPIIALTATPRDDCRQACLAAGMDDYLAKPASREDMGAALDRWRRPES